MIQAAWNNIDIFSIEVLLPNKNLETMKKWNSIFWDRFRAVFHIVSWIIN